MKKICKIFSLAKIYFPSPNIFLLQIIFSFSFSVCPLLGKKYIFFLQYFPPFPSLFFFSSAKNMFSFSIYFPHFPSSSIAKKICFSLYIFFSLLFFSFFGFLFLLNKHISLFQIFSSFSFSFFLNP